MLARWCISLGLAAVLSGAGVTAAKAETAPPSEAEKAAELKKLRARIADLRETLEAVRSQQDAVRTELRDLERRIGRLVHNLKELSAQLAERTARLQALRNEQRLRQGELATQRELLANQVRAAYAIGRQEYLKLLLNQEDPAAAGRVFTYYEYFNRARSTRIASVTETLNKLQSVQRAIEEETAQLTRLRDEQQRDKDDLQQAHRGRAAVMAKLDSEIRTGDQELARLLEDERELERVIAAITEALADVPVELERGASFAASRGKLTWPTGGPVEQLFGTRREKSRVTWNGVIINAVEGHEVRAVARGRVAFADWLRGYGLLLIIDHGNGYMTLYGHAQSLFKEAGDWVESDELIATVGRSGGRTAAGLYFEIRHNGKPVNPVQWCRRGRRG